MPAKDTIVGLSSGSLPSGVAVLRASGPGCLQIMSAHGIEDIAPRRAYLKNILHSKSSDVLDRGLCLWFPGPASFTGEDCLELQVHGGPAVVTTIIDSILDCPNTRLAEPGEFSRRAFENGKFDLTEIEGLSDLLSAQTEAQHKQALNQSSGALRSLYEGWRKDLVRIQAMMEAEIDFVEEDDVPEDAGRQVLSKLEELKSEIEAHLDDDRAGEIIRKGFQVVIMGAPNAGKSSLLNALAKRDVAIVTSEPGTTRDILDVHLNIRGYEVVFSDTAGIRETDNIVESEGIRRARLRAEGADLLIWLTDIDSETELNRDSLPNRTLLTLFSKDDRGTKPKGQSISAATGHGLDLLIEEIGDQVTEVLGKREPVQISRVRHRLGLERCVMRLGDSVKNADIELIAEDVRSAGAALGKITGRIDVEDLLDVIFAEFCVGK